MKSENFFLITLAIGLIDIGIIMSYAPEKYETIWILPMAFMIMSIPFHSIFQAFGKSIVATILISFMLLKNYFIPFLIALGTGKYTAAVDTTDVLLNAYFLCIYEFIVIFYVIKKNWQYTTNNNADFSLQINERLVRTFYKIMLFLLFLLIFIIIQYPQLLLAYDFDIFASEEEKILQVQLSEKIRLSTPKLPYYFYFFLFAWLRWLIPLAIILFLFVLKRNNHFWAISISSIAIILSSFLGTDYKTASVFILLSLFLFLTKLYPNYRKRLLILCLSFFSIIGILGLIFKSFGSNGLDRVHVQDLANMFQAYFSGPDNVAVALMIPNELNFDIIIGDIFKFIPYLAYFFQSFESSLTQFNQTFFQESDINSQIIPMISQGQRYFSFIGAPLFTYIICRYSFALEKRSKETHSLIYYLINIMLYIFLSFSISMYCFSQIITIFTLIYLPTILILHYLENKYNYRSSIISTNIN